MSQEESQKTEGEIKTPEEIGKKGGETTLKRHGSQHFKKMVERRWQKQQAPKKLDDDLFDFSDLLVFEMANNHQGSLEHGKNIISAMADIATRQKVRGVIKFQYRDYETIIHPRELKKPEHPAVNRFLSTKLSKDDFSEMVRHARERGLLVMATPFDEASVSLVEDFDLDILKIASCSSQDWPLLERAAIAGKPIIVSTGGLTLAQIDKIVSFLDHRNVQFALMHCIAIYPTPHEKLQLTQIKTLQNRYPHVMIGYSTHEEPENYEAIQMAYALGARIFERHVGIKTDTINLNAYSSTPEQVERWVEAFKRAANMMGPEKRQPADEQELADLNKFMRGVFLRRSLRKGEEIQQDDVFYAIPLEDGQMVAGSLKPGMVADKDYREHEALSSAVLDSYVPHYKEVIHETIHQVKGILNEARIPVVEGAEFNVELSHHYGLTNFREVGVVIIDCINREYCKKILVQLPGQRHPFHQHRKKEEAFQILWGTLEVELERGKRKTLHPGDVAVVHRGVWHRFWTETGCVFEEVSTTHFNNDSFYRDPRINQMEREERKTKLVNWGRYQFD